jgi:bacillithiol biosynthesis deacetylase BshB1
MKLDILAFSVHPDDVELGAAGAMMMALAEGKKVGVVDLTRGELGTRGTPEIRQQEADAASLIMGLSVRENLGMRDGFFANDEAHQLDIITCIRKYRPEIVLCNALEDRHPDHGRAARLVADSCFYAGLSKIKTTFNNLNQDAWRPKNVFHYLQDRLLNPDFVMDITPVFEKKLQAIKAYSTQFYNPEFSGPETYISTPAFLETLISRHQLLGKIVGVQYAEGFQSEKNIGIRSFDHLIHQVT